jgi:signal transduction histidine kinase/HAMP domain-containing protein
MRKFLSRLTIRTKLVAGFCVLLGIFFLSSLLVLDRLVEVRDEVATMVDERRPVELKSSRLSARLDDALAALGLFLSVRDPSFSTDYHRKLAEIRKITGALQVTPLISRDRGLTEMLQAVSTNVEEFSVLGEQLLRTAANDESIYPGLAYANEYINPINQEILQLVTQMLDSATDVSSDTERGLLLRIFDLRYYWINVVSGVRAYLAYRSDHVLHDAMLYLESARSALQDIRSAGDHLDLDQAQAAGELEDAVGRFGQHWKRLQEIHTSDGWRADNALMRARIAPLYATMERQLDNLAGAQKTAMDAFSDDLVTHSRQITQLVQAFLVIGTLASIVMAWGISRLVAMPIREVAGAMENIARGDAVLTHRLNAEGRDEIALLAGNFNTFIDKVRQSAEEDQAIGKLLRLSLKATDMHAYLDEALELMIRTVTWLSLLPKGGIFLTDNGTGQSLDLSATHNFSPELTSLCATVPFGHCLCGEAATSREIVFARCVDGRHHIRFEGMQPHGHYSVPIRSGPAVLGVLVLYLPDGHCRSVNEERFLRTVAEVLSMGISLRRVNIALLAAKQRAEFASEQLTGIAANLPGIIFQYHLSTDAEPVYTYVGPGTAHLLGTDSDDAAADIVRLFHQVHSQDKQRVEGALRRASEQTASINLEYRVVQNSGDTRWILCNAAPRSHADGSVVWDGLLLDITQRKNLEIQLLQAQKLESVGQLAAGIAHEINTPAQYVQDNARFLQDAFSDYRSALAALQRLRGKLSGTTIDAELLAVVDRTVEESDIDYLAEEIPRAITQSLEGLQRIGSIVSAMKEFSHPGNEAKQPVDVNAVIRNVVTVSRNEWKYVADLEIDLDEDLPYPPGYRDKLGQVFLNLIVNAAHAIGDKFTTGGNGKGRILISTSQVGEEVEIRVSDNGHGVPEAIESRIFDPFFTTKAVGKGTGQGLSIARSVVVDQHQGSLTLESTPGCGAAFVIRLRQNDDSVDEEGAFLTMA